MFKVIKLSKNLILVLAATYILTLYIIVNVINILKCGPIAHDNNILVKSYNDEDKIIGKILEENNQAFKQDDPSLVKFVRKNFLIEPNNKPYNLDNGSNENPSQLKQNLLVHHLLNNMTNGFFVECGAWDGEFLSNTLYLEKFYGWTGLLVEAQRDLYDRLKLKNRKSWISNTCASTVPYPKIMSFYMNNGISTLLSSNEGLKKTFNFDPQQSDYEVQCIPLYTLLAALDIKIVDYLSLDVEGADFEVLKTIPFEKIIFKVLEIEVTWVSEGKQAVRNFLESRDYIFVTEFVQDFIFIHSSHALALGLLRRISNINKNHRDLKKRKKLSYID